MSLFQLLSFCPCFSLSFVPFAVVLYYSYYYYYYYPEKVSALVQMKSPENISELRCFMGMANQLDKFSSRLAELSQPLCVLLSTKNEWNWGPKQEQAFRAVKEELTKSTTLGLYSPAAKTKVVSDASFYGLGAFLLQQDQQGWKPIAFASQS